ncbi:MAG: hypothetical protein MRY83_18475 [Flavobacteriales bacterium]|nr:hypothetical protein [Flavobacteriales bacterium]
MKDQVIVLNYNMQTWKDQHILFSTQNYAAVPFILEQNDSGLLKIAFSSRDRKNRSIPKILSYDFYNRVVVDIEDIKISLGELGTFDQDGIMPCCKIQVNNKQYLFYIGWNNGYREVPFRNALGIAIWDNERNEFYKYSSGPVMDRGIFDHCFVAGCTILKDESIYHMYYLSCDEWRMKEKGPMHYYKIKYAKSTDCINWERKGEVMIDFKNELEYAISCPRVIKEEEIFKMWYSFRASADCPNYQIGYAESLDGKNWERKDELISFIRSESYNSRMMCYPFVFDLDGNKYMLYNGNNYGEDGIMLTKLLDEV